MDARSLLLEARQGRLAAQKRLFEAFADRMLMVCRRYVKSPEDAEEIMLDGFLKFFKTIDSVEFQGEAALFAWIKRIMINECLMFLRRNASLTIVSETDALEQPVEPDFLDRLTAAELFSIIIQLPVGYRTVFNLFEVEGWSHAEIGKLLGIQEATSRSQLFKARALLQNKLVQNYSHYVSK